MERNSLSIDCLCTEENRANMRVLYDYQAFMQRAGGVSRYFADLISALNGIIDCCIIKATARV